MESIRELIGGYDGILEPRLGEVVGILHRYFASSKQLGGVSRESLKDITDEAGHQLLGVGEIHLITRVAATVGMVLSSATSLLVA